MNKENKDMGAEVDEVKRLIYYGNDNHPMKLDLAIEMMFDLLGKFTVINREEAEKLFWNRIAALRQTPTPTEAPSGKGEEAIAFAEWLHQKPYPDYERVHECMGADDKIGLWRKPRPGKIMPAGNGWGEGYIPNGYDYFSTADLYEIYKAGKGEEDLNTSNSNSEVSSVASQSVQGSEPHQQEWRWNRCSDSLNELLKEKWVIIRKDEDDWRIMAVQVTPDFAEIFDVASTEWCRLPSAAVKPVHDLKPRMNYWGASEKDVEQYTKDLDAWEKHNPIKAKPTNQ